MGYTKRTILFAALWSCVLQAQQKSSGPSLLTNQAEEQLLENLGNASEQERSEVAKKRAAAYEFMTKWNKAVETMNILGHALQDGKADLKKFRSADKALRELRADPNWLGK